MRFIQGLIRNAKALVRKLSKEMDKLHRFSHFESVAENAAIIAKAEGYDEDIASLAAWLHDIGRSSYKGTWVKETETSHHGMIGADMARKFLATKGCDPAVIDDICESIASHVWPSVQRTVLSKVLWDADKLWAFSAKSKDIWVSYLRGKGKSLEGAQNEIRDYRSFCYAHFYTKKAKEIAERFMKENGIEAKSYIIPDKRTISLDSYR